jgi:hypothetical protein
MQQSAQYKGNDKLQFGIILGVLSSWLFAQTILNINVDMAGDLKRPLPAEGHKPLVYGLLGEARGLKS